MMMPSRGRVIVVASNRICFKEKKKGKGGGGGEMLVDFFSDHSQSLRTAG